MRFITPHLAWPFALLALAPLTASAAQTIDERRPLAADGSVTVVNVAGDIQVSTWDREEVHLSGELGEESELDVSGNEQRLRFEVRPRNGNRYGRNYEESDLVLVVPARAAIAASGVSSDISVRGAAGASLSAESVSGDVEAQAEVGRADLKSVSGDIVFSGASPRITAESVSGDVELDGASGELNVSVVSGDVDVRGGDFDRGRFEAVSGTLQLVLGVRAGGSVHVESMSGDVRVTLPAAPDVEIEAQTFSGSIHSAFGSPQKVSRGPGSRLAHVAGAGGASLRLESFSGDVQISQQ